MRSSSPAKHRHDGTSPLPMGIDWSHPPKKWEGRDTVWPHDPQTGWSYCVVIPSWVVQPESGASGDNLLNSIIFYRIQVGIQSPEGVSTSRVILRRFSDFLRLSSAVKKALPRKIIPAAPPKHALLRINLSRVLLEERRLALEEWMGKLLSDIDVSRSAPVAAFLELEAAIRSSFQDDNLESLGLSALGGAVTTLTSIPFRTNSGVSVAESSTVASKPQSVASDFSSDSAYETSDVGSPRLSRLQASETGIRDLASANDLTDSVGPCTNGVLGGESFLDHPEQYFRGKLHDTKEDRVSRKTRVVEHSSNEVFLSRDTLGFMSEQDHHAGHARKPSDESIGSDISSVRGSELSNQGVSISFGDGSLTAVVEAHNTREALAVDAHFLNDAQIILPIDQRHKLNRLLLMLQQRLVTAKTDMEDLIARLNQEVAVKEYLTTKVKDLEGDLEVTKQKSKENLQQAIVIERERVTQMQWDMEELRRKYMEVESKLKFEQSEKTRAVSEKTTASGEKELLLQELDAKQVQVETFEKRLEDLVVKSKADIKLLVKEVKFLRSSQAEQRDQLNQCMKQKAELERAIQKDNQWWAKAKAGRKKLLHECKVLRSRLEECSVNFLSEGEDMFIVSPSSLSDALDLLTTSDNRIGLLLAEAQLLAQDEDQSMVSSEKPSIDGEDTAGTDGEIRTMLTDLLIDNARLRKQINSVNQCALKTAFKQKEEVAAEAHSRKSVLNLFLDR